MPRSSDCPSVRVDAVTNYTSWYLVFMPWYIAEFIVNQRVARFDPELPLVNDSFTDITSRDVTRQSGSSMKLCGP